jgi:hypothetical protein
MVEQIFSATKKSKVGFSAYIWIRPVVNGNETLPERGEKHPIKDTIYTSPIHTRWQP